MLTKKKILLIGGGHAHIQVLHLLSKVDPQLFELTLISDRQLSPYSGMLPSYMAGVYSADQLHFDLKDICMRFNFNFIEDLVTLIEPRQNQVETRKNGVFKYDAASVNIGIQPHSISTVQDSHLENEIIYLKPISKLIQRWNKMITSEQKKSLDITLIGGGAAAFEVAVACRRHFSSLQNKIKIISGHAGLLSDQNEKTQRLARKTLKELNIELIEKVRVQKIESHQLILDNGIALPRQICFVATSAQAPQIFNESNLPVNEKGFVKVDDQLFVQGYSNLLAAGDCCEFNNLSLPKAGVFAVREGPILFNNIYSFISGESKYQVYKPQKRYLTILITKPGQAIASFGNFTFQGKLAWRLKNYIDLKFMNRFR